MRSDLEHRFDEGHLDEAVLRALVYIRLPEGSVDERVFRMLALIRDSRPAAKRMSLARFKLVLREQVMLVLLDEERAVDALPGLLGTDAAARTKALETLHQLIAARGELPAEGQRRLARVETLFSPEKREPRRREQIDA